VVGVLQSGTVLHVRNVTHHGERIEVYNALRAVTGKSIGNRASDWRAWFAQQDR
jgi:hypothetical protein